MVGRAETDLIMFEGKYIVLAAIVAKGLDLSEFRPKAEKILEEFEVAYQWQLANHDGALNGYHKFVYDTYLKIPIYEIDGSVVFEQTETKLDKSTLQGLSYDDLKRLLEAVNGVRTTKDILNTTWDMMRTEVVITLLGLGYYLGILRIKENVVKNYTLLFADHDMFGLPYPAYVVNKLVAVMYKAFGEDQMNSLLPLCDGTKTIDDISAELHVEKEILAFVVKELVRLGGLVLVQKIETEGGSIMEWSL